jgi:hypothetical protein
MRLRGHGLQPNGHLPATLSRGFYNQRDGHDRLPTLRGQRAGPIHRVELPAVSVPAMSTALSTR